MQHIFHVACLYVRLGVSGLNKEAK